MEHPLIGNLDTLTADECQIKISELTKKLTIASRSGNGHLCQQLRMALESYQSRMRSIYDDQMKKDGDNPALHFDKIDIS
jgi:hypothetical protein